LVAVKCGHLIDGTGSNPVVGAVVVIEGERIKAVGREAPPGATVIDLSVLHQR
jgi:imidazolonepropionase-like amidohydrolase